MLVVQSCVPLVFFLFVIHFLGLQVAVSLLVAVGGCSDSEMKFEGTSRSQLYAEAQCMVYTIDLLLVQTESL